MSRGSVDPMRIARALYLDVEPLGPDTYRVSGGREAHVVERRRCDCADARIRRFICKHRLSVYLHRSLHPTVRDALREVCR